MPMTISIWRFSSLAWLVLLLLWTCVSQGCVQQQKTIKFPHRPPPPRPVPPRPLPPPPERDHTGSFGRALSAGQFSLSKMGKLLQFDKKGKLSATQINPHVRKSNPQLQRCTRGLLKRFPGSSRSFQVKLWVGPTGRVWKTRLIGDVRSDPRTKKCLKRVLHRIQFPPPGGFFVWLQKVQWKPLPQPR